MWFKNSYDLNGALKTVFGDAILIFALKTIDWDDRIKNLLDKEWNYVSFLRKTTLPAHCVAAEKQIHYF